MLKFLTLKSQQNNNQKKQLQQKSAKWSYKGKCQSHKPKTKRQQIIQNKTYPKHTTQLLTNQTKKIPQSKTTQPHKLNPSQQKFNQPKLKGFDPKQPS